MKYFSGIPLFLLSMSTHCTRLAALTGKQITSPGNPYVSRQRWNFIITGTRYSQPLEIV